MGKDILILKNEIPLKELEGFGFKPKYDTDTGEIVRYVKSNDINEILVTIEKTLITYGQYDYREIWVVHINEIGDNIASLIYDLTKEDIIEKYNA